MDLSTSCKQLLTSLQVFERAEPQILPSIRRTRIDDNCRIEVLISVHRKSPDVVKVTLKEESAASGTGSSERLEFSASDADENASSYNRVVDRLSRRILPMVMKNFTAEPSISSFTIVLRFRRGNWSSYTVIYEATAY